MNPPALAKQFHSPNPGFDYLFQVSVTLNDVNQFDPLIES
jgi:hypothetical protein